MPRYRLSHPAKVDVASVLRISEARHGVDARIRYRGLLTAAFRRIAAFPDWPSSADRREVRVGLRSLHLRHCRDESRETGVGHPVHVIFYREVEPGLIEIVRVLHDRMEPTRHVGV